MEKRIVSIETGEKIIVVNKELKKANTLLANADGTLSVIKGELIDEKYYSITPINMELLRNYFYLTDFLNHSVNLLTPNLEKDFNRILNFIYSKLDSSYVNDDYNIINQYFQSITIYEKEKNTN